MGVNPGRRAGTEVMISFRLLLSSSAASSHTAYAPSFMVLRGVLFDPERNETTSKGQWAIAR